MPNLRQTTVRFDTESWERIGEQAARLGIPRSAFIREAAQARVSRSECRDEVRQLRERIDRLEALVTRTLQRRRSL